MPLQIFQHLTRKLMGTKALDAPRGGRANVAQGAWGEAQAAAYLERQGLRVRERNARPCPKDKRCEIDLIMEAADGTGVVFVEVKTHRRHSPYASRLASVDVRKKTNLRRACACWVTAHHWHGNFRFDVVEIYGERFSGVPPEIDHIANVPLFARKWRFW